MKIFLNIGLFFAIIAFSACENEVEINSEFTEVTSVYGLLNANEDTNYIRISKTFLDEEKNAIELAKDPNSLYYDSLKVELVENGSGNTFELKKVFIPTKEDGLFTPEKNQAYLLNADINEEKTYNLSITKQNGEMVTAKTTTINQIRLLKPNPFLGSNSSVGFVNSFNNITDLMFEFETADQVGEFQAIMNFYYFERIGNDTTKNLISFPLATFSNPGGDGRKTYSIIFDGNKFFNKLESEIPISLNPPKRFVQEGSIEILIYAADVNYSLYRDVNGPIDGLAQTRPEFTNVNNGIGLFASRSTFNFQTIVNSRTEDYIINTYGDEKELSQYRGFEYP